MFQALRVKDFRLLWAGRLVSLLGTWLLTVAVPARVLQLTGSLMATGLTLAAEYLPVLVLGPFAGVLSDRWDRRRVMLSTDVFRAGAVALLLLAHSPGTVWVIYLALAAESTGAILFRPAAQAHVPAVLGTGPQLSSANSLNALTDGTVRLVGAPLGAALMLALGFPVLVYADVASYLVSALAIAATSRYPVPRPAGRSTVRQITDDLRHGLASVNRQPTVRWLLPITTLFLTANAALSALLVPFGVRTLGGPRQAGLVVSALGVGFLIGAPLIRVLVDRVQPRWLMTGSLTGTGLGFCLLFTAPALSRALAAALTVGVFGSMTLITPQTTLQRTLPNDVLGRVSAVFFTAEALATLAGSVAGPTLAEHSGITTLALAASTVTLTTAIISLTLLPTSPTPAQPRGDHARSDKHAAGTDHNQPPRPDRQVAQDRSPRGG